MKKLFRSITVIFSLMTVVASAQQSPNIFTYKLGAFEVCLLSEGQNTGNSNIFVGATSEMIQQCLPQGVYPNSCNAFLVRMPGKIVLVDAGFGRNLFDNLKSLGITPDQVDAVLITHVHGDHLGGMLIDGKAAFSKAELYISKAEYEYCMNDDAKNAGPRKVIEAYQSRLRLFKPEEIDVQPDLLFAGIRAVAAYGHTPGHTLYMVESGSEKLLIWGDLTHAMAIQMPYPQVAMTYDTNTEMAIAARKKILEYVAGNKIPVAGMHTAFPGMGKLEKESGGGYSFTPFQ